MFRQILFDLDSTAHNFFDFFLTIFQIFDNLKITYSSKTNSTVKTSIFYFLPLSRKGTMSQSQIMNSIFSN